MTPLQAIKKRCKDCMPIKSEFNNDFCNDCQLKNTSLTNLKKIKAYCLWCMNGSKKEILLCTDKSCSLWIFRNGHNPNRKGIGNISYTMSKKAP